MPLDPDLASALRDIDEESLPADLEGPALVAAARRIHERKAVTVTPPERRAHVGHVADRAIPGPAGSVPVRIYEPDSSAGPRPAVVWLHGGGWITGSLDTADTLARAVCAALDAIVVSVDYRLAPEHPWPAGLEDSLAALRWTAAHAADLGIDGGRIVIGGDSAGGNLAAVVAQHPDRPDLAAQLLLYPAVDLDAAADYPSRSQNATGYGLTLDDAAISFSLYPGGADVSDPRISPLHAPSFRGLPPAVVAVAEYDPLRDEGIAYAARLADAGVPVQLHQGTGLAHGCFDMLGTVGAAREELRKILSGISSNLS